MNRLLLHISGLVIGIFVISSLFTSCDKDTKLAEDPYAGGRDPLGIAFTKSYPYPEITEPGNPVTFHIKGLKAQEGKFEFFINNNKVDILETTDSTVQVMMPALASSGEAVVKISGQFFRGPIVYVEGNVSVDENYDLANGFNGPVTDIIAQSGGHIATGMFTDFENEASESVYRNSIHFVNSLGESDNSFNFQRGAEGVINTIVRGGNNYFIGGTFSSFNNRDTDYITRLLANGQLDTMVVELLNPTPDRPENALDTVPAFNGGTSGGIGGGNFATGNIIKLFPVAQDKLIAVGTFFYHKRIDYNYSTRESRRTIYTPVRHVMRMTTDGSLDSAYMMENTGANGTILAASMQEDEKLLLGGMFTSFNGKPARYLVRLNTDGSIDNTFNIGTGPNDNVSSVEYNSKVGKMVVTGSFTSFNGVSAPGIVVLDKQGNIDPGFKVRPHGEGYISYAYIMNNGKILVDNSLESYDGITRSGLLILNPDGAAEQKYNNIGLFLGTINKVVETTSSLGNPALLLGGSIYSVEGKSVRQMVKLEIKD